MLDVGSGGGKATIAAAQAVAPTGAAIGADISAQLTELAIRRATEAGVDNVSFRVADMQVDDIGAGPYDAVMSQFGVMFFDEPLVAFANIHAHLAPQGRIAFACWQTFDRNPWFIGTALAGIVPPPPPPEPGKSPTGPFALGDHERTQHILESAGFANVRRTAHDLHRRAAPRRRRRRLAAPLPGRATRPDAHRHRRGQRTPRAVRIRARRREVPDSRSKCSEQPLAKDSLHNERTAPCNTFVSAAPGSKFPGSASAP